MSAETQRTLISADPVHTHQVGGHPIRFFRPPNGSLDFPWAALDDVLDATNLAQSTKDALTDKVSTGEYADAVRNVRAPGADLSIVPSYIYDGLMNALCNEGIVPHRVSAQLHIASCAAFQAIHADLSAAERVNALFSIIRQNRDDDAASANGEGDVA